MRRLFLSAVLALWGSVAAAQTIGCPVGGVRPYGGSICAVPCCVLNQFTALPNFALSLRKVNALYTGNDINVTRASDSTSQGIGFANNLMNTAALMVFCAATTCTVNTWYDQSGAGNSATQTTVANQPVIVVAGVLQVQNGRSSLRFNGGQFLNALEFGAPATNFWSNYVASIDDITNNNENNIGADGLGFTQPSLYLQNSGAIFNNAGNASILSTGPVVNLTPYIATLAYQSTNNAQNYQNGALLGNSAITNYTAGTYGNFRIGYYTAPALSGYVSEFIGASGQALTTGNQHILEHNQESYYGISGQ